MPTNKQDPGNTSNIVGGKMVQGGDKEKKKRKRNKKPRRSDRDDGNELMKLPLEETPPVPADARSSHICVSERSPPVSRQALCPPRLEH